MEKNKDIKQLIVQKRLRQYEVAKELNVSEFTLSRWLNREMNQERREKIMKAIDEASKALGV